ncbi:MAG: class I SAM-dependent methyltransferase [Cyanobacteriota bacterium]|nr:class I SAM-dependent methyltransferase [Cyanobacteriota bacterium]
MTAILNFQTAPGHQILAAAGKKILRPGGKAATEQLFEWADFQPDDTVLELAASFGESAIAMAKRFGVRVVGIEKNPDSVAKARENIRAAGLEGRAEIVTGDIFGLDVANEGFDYVLAEAILTMQSAAGKAKILNAIRDRLKPGGKFLSHELFVRADARELERALSQTLRVNASPLSVDGWQAVCNAAGLTVRQYKTGKMGLLDFQQMLRDEGALTTLRILWNLLSNGKLRDRVLQMRRAFQQNSANLGYIICAIEKPNNS